MFTDLVYAMGETQGQAGGSGGGLTALLPLVVMFVIFYFLLIRPQQKKAKEHRNFLANLRKGDKIVTSGGLYGEITGLSDQTITVEIAPKIRVKVGRGYIAGVAGSGSPEAAQPPAESGN